ncbi:MAG: right-handed parallel beta-helix repeat-containing protein, partial [Candidatus Cloacimonetes bacterium]|nr:right-handed parallel beta-helix repeat-containing protein [Candidatus Cloacimonadota bacterium]
CSIIFADSLNPHTIFLSDGTYSSTETGEFFPINIPSNVSLIGENEDNVILDAEGITGVMKFDNVDNVSISNLTITNGSTTDNGGGIYCYSSDPNFENVTITNNSVDDGFGGGIYCENSNPILTNVTIMNNLSVGVHYSNHGGGGIYCYNSDPFLNYVTITNNSAHHGGGVYSNSSCPNLDNVTIMNNSAYSGAGIYGRYDSDITLNNVIIKNNSASHSGGGIYLTGSNLNFTDIIISNNSSAISGGGIYFNSSELNCDNVLIENNSSGGNGGGFYCHYSDPILENLSIINNSAYQGGGIYISTNSTPVFSSANRCNIYLNNNNNRGCGRDIYSEQQITVIVDTFTVSYPTDFYASPIENFNFNILNGVLDQINADLFVSPEGDNSNSGLSMEEPLKTIQHAYSIIFVNDLNPHTIFLAEGTYSPSGNGDFFPINLLENISLTGVNEDNVILDAEGLTGVILFDQVENVAISNLSITNGSSSAGGGIYCENSNPIIENVTIKNNSVVAGDGDYRNGGGIYCCESNPTLINVTISNNYAADRGGGVYCENSNPHLENVSIVNNSTDDSGGGIYCKESNPILETVSIVNNSAVWGGGINLSYNSYPVFSSENRCNIYLNNVNNRGVGSDIYSSVSINVIVDTFTMINPTDFQASPIESFTFDILHGIQDQVSANLFVSPQGNNNNSGLSVDDPLKTIQYACSIIFADSLNPLTIFLSEGTYSSSGNGEFFPINIPNNVSLIGQNEENVILDAEDLAGVICLVSVENVTISNLKITNGFASNGLNSMGGGILCNNSGLILENVTISNNSANYGGGIHFSSYSSNLILFNVTIDNNSAAGASNFHYGGGIYCTSSYPILENVSITNNSASEGGGGIYFNGGDPILKNVMISNNSAALGLGGGIYCWGSDPNLENVTITNNSAVHGGGIYCEGMSILSLVNCIMWNDTPEEIFFDWEELDTPMTIAYSNIEGGLDAEESYSWSNYVYWLDGNINTDPLFVDQENGDYYLSENSPCIDTGIAYLYAQGEVLIDLSEDEYHGTAPDMGTYEWQAIGIDNPPSTPTSIHIEMNGDDAVLSWDEVTTTIYGNPMAVDFYLVYHSNSPSGNFMFLYSTSETTYTHTRSGMFNEKVYYKISAFIGSRQALERHIENVLKKQNNFKK